MPNPFAKLISLHVDEQRIGFSKLGLDVAQEHLNPHGVVHGAVVYALADTGMGVALYPTSSWWPRRTATTRSSRRARD